MKRLLLLLLFVAVAAAAIATLSEEHFAAQYTRSFKRALDHILDVTQLVALLAALVIGFGLGRYRTHFFQNRGEAKVADALRRRFVPPDYHLLNHVTLRVGEGTTQIDHVLVSRFGIFVIETKDYRGWIFGQPDDRYWTQGFFQVRYRFPNPVRQNYGHARAVQELLEFLPADTIRPVVVFAGTAELKTTAPNGVFTLEEFLTYLESQTVEVMSINRLQFCVGRLETARLSITKVTDVEHVQRLRSRFGNDE